METSETKFIKLKIKITIDIQSSAPRKGKFKQSKTFRLCSMIRLSPCKRGPFGKPPNSKGEKGWEECFGPTATERGMKEFRG
jgi:hypothetical protein